ncbi:MAG: hypothetical protein EHM43_08615 [Ignavibacteriae bacterium]|nr:MAG: hypothetical protein EHM43_08615 [Ignavibacteriota bacterium]
MQRFDLGGQISRITYTTQFCGAPDLNVITTGVSGRGRVTWPTTPTLDTVSLFDWFGINAPTRLQAIDYDGIEPLEYVNSQGVIWRCSQGESPFPLMPIDTVANDVCSNAPVSSADVDGDGYRDVITEIGRNGVTTRLILGGPSAGKGCERTLVVPVVKTANKYNQTKAFYKSVAGEWRLIQQERDSSDRAPRLQVYRVNFTRTSGKPDVAFTPLGMYRGEDVSQIDEPYGDIGVVPDSLNGRDHMLFRHRIGPPGSTWALERFDVTEGSFVSTQEVVVGYEFATDLYVDFQYNLGTSKPIVKLTSYFGPLFCLIDDIAHPFAKWDPTGSGTSPVIGYTSVNDQTGDGIPDVVVVGGSLNSSMVVLTLDTANTSERESDAPLDLYAVRLVGSQLEVSTPVECWMTISIVSIDGRVMRTNQAAFLAPGITNVDIEPHIRPLASGQYFLSVTINGSTRLLPFKK